MKNCKNYAFIDGQNLYYNTVGMGWKIDVFRFRKYLTEKFQVEKAFYFFGYREAENLKAYRMLRKAGFILVFREHYPKATSRKKGNVDTDIVFSVMEKLYHREKFGGVILVSGDGDYFRMVKLLRDEGRLEKIMFPTMRQQSALYRRIEQRYKLYLDEAGVRKRIEFDAKKDRD